LARVLDKGGILLAVVFGAVLLISGGLAYLALMLAFFVLAVIVTRYEYEVKRDLGLYEHERGWENVLSNGLLPAILAVLSPVTGPMPFIASISAVTGDKFGSEIGVLAAENPISVLDLKPVKPGTSGAMSRIGTVASLAGSTALCVCAMFAFGINPAQALLLSVAGFVGCIADTLFGVFEERGIGTKGTTNFICSLVGALLAYFFIH
jgi:uncharacterized protein (TIGR00297 family)